MIRRYRSSVVLAVLLGVPAIAVACLWDYDTLKQERARFPTTLELITGKFLRHSNEFYYWRIQDRLNKLAKDPTNLAYHDDLAVAYEKTGQHDKAVETILAKEKIKPGLYETYSNLGTFHILAGDFEQGLPYIDKALAINPDAHFGRERYQKWLVEYAMERRTNGKLQFPLQAIPADVFTGHVSTGFQAFLKQRLGKEELTETDMQGAVKGVLGMMRFANHNNPLLLEALGDLLVYRYRDFDAKRLAARCYLKASQEVKDPEAQQRYRRLAEHTLRTQTRHPNTHDELKLAELEAAFAAELADAEKWYADLRQKESGWIRDDKDADAEFDRLYSEEPTAIEEVVDDSVPPARTNPVVVALCIGAILLVGLVVLRWSRRPGNSGG